MRAYYAATEMSTKSIIGRYKHLANARRAAKHVLTFVGDMIECKITGQTCIAEESEEQVLKRLDINIEEDSSDALENVIPITQYRITSFQPRPIDYVEMRGIKCRLGSMVSVLDDNDVFHEFATIIAINEYSFTVRDEMAKINKIIVITRNDNTVNRGRCIDY